MNKAWQEAHDWSYGWGFLWNTVCSSMCGCKGHPRAFAYYVDEEKVARLKKEMKGEQPYISTNDLLTAHFLMAVPCTIGGMAINFRGRVEGITPDLAGNYEGQMLFDPNAFEGPAALRAALNAGSP